MRTTDRITHATTRGGIPAPTPARRPHPATLRWRREQLIAAGLDELSAHRIARDGSVDIHALVMSAEHQSARVKGGRHGR